jgi:hypothetical protein
MLAIKENTTSLPMLFVSRQNNIKDKEVNYVQGRTTLQYRCAYLSSSITSSYESFSHSPFFSASDLHRKARWSWTKIIFQAILMAYEPSASLKDRFSNARECLIGMFPNRRRPGRTYQGYVKALVRIPSKIREQLQICLCRGHKRVAGRSWKLFGWIPFAVDGSRLEAPRTEANEQALGCAGKKKSGPQLLLTTLYHMGSGLPWRWCIGRGIDQERNHLRSLLSFLPKGCSLLVADAGFNGFELFKEILGHNLSFLIRVGANVTLLTDLGLDVERKGQTLWLWPGNKRNQPPLRLRLIRLKVKTKHSRKPEDVYLLTNVFETHRLSDEIAGQFYKMRWGVEVFYRSFKQTLGHCKLRSRSPELAQEELHWALTALLLLGLMGVDGLARKKQGPLSLSVADALRKVRFAMRTPRRWRFRDDLRILFAKASKDQYKRSSSKQARDWAHKKKESPPGAPKIRRAKPNEIACAKRSYKVA